MVKISRRQTLKYLGIATLTPGLLLPSAFEHKQHRSWWNMLFHSQPMSKPETKPEPQKWSNDSISMAWIGHSTVLLNFYGTIILTDPILTDRIGIDFLGLFKIGPQRLIEPALRVNEIPKPHLIVLSHAHMDHLDIETLRSFPSDIPIITARNTSDVLDNLSRKQVTELDWGETCHCQGVYIEALRVKHFGWRYPWEEDRSRGNWYGRSFNAYLLSKNNHYILFGGDTAYQEYFLEMKKRGITVICALMPIGAYNPWIHNHCTPEQAVQMAEHVGAKYFFPIHWGTFIQSNEPTNEPIERLEYALASTSMKLGWKKHGESWILKESTLPSLTDEEKDSILMSANHTERQ